MQVTSALSRLSGVVGTYLHERSREGIDGQSKGCSETCFSLGLELAPELNLSSP
jgi:hypothetical protein